MNKTTKETFNKKISEFVSKIGGEEMESHGVGFYWINGALVDLTASGEEPWQITKNILRQL